AFMQMRNVVSAVEVVIHKDFPVAVYVISAAVEVVQLADAERRHALDQAAEEAVERRSLWVQIYEYEFLPGFRLHRNQTILLALKILYTVEFGHALQRTIQPVIPAVMRAMQDGSLPARLCDHGCGVMTADVIKAAQNAVISAHHDDRFAGNAGGDELARLFHLLRPSHHLPGLAEHGLRLQFGKSRVHIPRRGNRRSI